MTLIAKNSWKLIPFCIIRTFVAIFAPSKVQSLSWIRYAFVHQFDIVSSAGRDAMEESRAPESRTDLTIGGVGVKVNF